MKGPKKTTGAFFFYQAYRRDTLKAENPSFGNKEIVARMGAEWRGMSEE